MLSSTSPKKVGDDKSVDYKTKDLAWSEKMRNFAAEFIKILKK